jgi:hypothetical protein
MLFRYVGLRERLVLNVASLDGKQFAAVAEHFLSKAVLEVKVAAEPVRVDPRTPAAAEEKCKVRRWQSVLQILWQMMVSLRWQLQECIQGVRRRQ